MRLKKQGTSTYQLSRAPRGTCLDWGIIFGFPLISLCLLKISLRIHVDHIALWMLGAFIISHLKRIAPKHFSDFLPKWNTHCVVPRPNIIHIEWVTVTSRLTNVGIFMLLAVLNSTFSISTESFSSLFDYSRHVDNKSFVAWIDLFTALCKPSWPWVKS